MNNDTTPSYEQLYMDHQRVLAEYYRDSVDFHKQIIQLKDERNEYMNTKSIPLDIQRSLVTACYITIMQYFPKRNNSASARAYVKQSIEAIRYIVGYGSL